MIPLGILASSGSSLDAGLELIATINATGANATMSLTSIPATYTHLQLRFTGRATSAATTATMRMRFNVLSTSIYRWAAMNGSGSTVAGTGSGGTATEINLQTTPAANAGAGVFAVGVWDILDYSSTSKAKSMMGFNGWVDQSSQNVWMTTGVCNRPNEAISSIQVTTLGTAWAVGSRLSLYGRRG